MVKRPVVTAAMCQPTLSNDNDNDNDNNNTNNNNSTSFSCAGRLLGVAMCCVRGRHLRTVLMHYSYACYACYACLMHVDYACIRTCKHHG